MCTSDFIAASRPMKVLLPRRLTTRSVSIAAPIAPASPVWGERIPRPRERDPDVIHLRFDRRQVVLRTTLQTKRLPRLAMRGICRRTATRSWQHLRKTRKQLFFGVAFLWKFTRSNQNTAQP